MDWYFVFCGDRYLWSVVVTQVIRMAAEVLNGVMCRKISVDALVSWLTTDHMVISENDNLLSVDIIRP